ncbi:MAG: hypothetical protein EOO65_03160 [Methanosarcinales archaeon]|nr:MAG: hypothetical protein EOO65_03160 [Methanosarcinales archaeon]
MSIVRSAPALRPEAVAATRRANQLQQDIANARVFAKNSSNAAGLALYRQLQEKYGNDPEVMLGIGICLRRSGKFFEAVEALECSANDKPSPLVFSQLALTYKKQGHLQPACFVLESGLKRFPNSPSLQELSEEIAALPSQPARLSASTRDYFEASRPYMSTLEASLDHIQVSYEMGDFPTALKKATEVLKTAPHRTVAQFLHSLRADCYMQLRLPRDAKRERELAVQKMSELAAVGERAGASTARRVHASHGGGAAAHASAAAPLNDGWTLATTSRSRPAPKATESVDFTDQVRSVVDRSREAKGDRAQLTSCLDELNALKAYAPTYLELMLGIAWISYLLGRHREASALFQAAHDEHGARGSILLGLARCSQRLGDLSTALFHVQAGLAEAPNMRALRDLRAEIVASSPHTIAALPPPPPVAPTLSGFLSAATGDVVRSTTSHGAVRSFAAMTAAAPPSVASSVAPPVVRVPERIVQAPPAACWAPAMAPRPVQRKRTRAQLQLAIDNAFDLSREPTTLNVAGEKYAALQEECADFPDLWCGLGWVHYLQHNLVDSLGFFQKALHTHDTRSLAWQSSADTQPKMSSILVGFARAAFASGNLALCKDITAPAWTQEQC